MRRKEKVGLWMIGACGSVGSAVALGLAALRKGLAGTEGLVSSLPAFEGAGLVDPGRIVVGGHEIRGQTLLESVDQSRERAGLFDVELIRGCASALRAVQKNVARGTMYGATPGVGGVIAPEAALDDRIPSDRSAAQAVERLTHDLVSFRQAHRLDQIVVVNVASCEPGQARAVGRQREFTKLQQAMARPGACVLPTSSLYALAAIEAGCAYVNFTPSTGIDVAAIRHRADDLGACYMGRDGKTGETLVKSVLAPMFALRNLKVLSWVGHNMLGNRDGAVLSDARTRSAKIKSKDATIAAVLGYKPTTHTSIEYIPSLDDWKVAWDFIHFQGFLGAKMSMQFTWQGSDSMLAAPLVIDLARFAALELRGGATGPMQHLACFFKDPMGVPERDYFTQWRRLVQYVGRIGKKQ